MTEQLQQLVRVALPADKKVLGMDHPDMMRLRQKFGMQLTLL